MCGCGSPWIAGPCGWWTDVPPAPCSPDCLAPRRLLPAARCPACLQVVEAAEAACIHDTIVNRFPLKYDTMVGERGLRLR